ncbi:MAG TPA: MaoC family dehydratase N-terminal domain-containing protein, partial [Polyangia bacterium]
MVLDVERGHIRRFAEAIGDGNPIYVDEAAARAAGHPRIPAPPTFAIALRANDPRGGIDLDWRKLLHGEQELVLARPLYAGDRLTIVGRIAE